MAELELGDPATMELLLAHGAEVKDSGEVALESSYNLRCARCAEMLIAKGLSKLDYTIALVSIAVNGDINPVRVMLDHGADVNAADPSGRTPLMYAAASDLLPALAVSAARKSGSQVDEETAARQVKANVFGLEKLRDYLHQGFLNPVEDFFAPFVVSNMLIGLDAERYKADLNTDAAAMFLKARQTPDGQWPYVAGDPRPPICTDYIEQSAVSMRALQLYAPELQREAYQQAVQLAASWLAKTRSVTNEDRAYRLLGLAWAGKKDAAEGAMRELLDKQRPDGGWSDLDTLESSGFFTGKSLYSLQVAGLPASDAAYRRAVQFLLRTQQEDGSWFVRSRALALQPYFDAGFPHGFNQWISAAGTSWATVALAQASQAQAQVSTGRGEQ